MTRAAGFTLFEVLVSLAVIALMTGIILAARPTPSSELRLEAAANALIEEATRLRHRAVTAQSDQNWRPDAKTCDDDDIEVIFYTDGTAYGSEICLVEEGRQLRLEVNVLAGRLVEVSP